MKPEQMQQALDAIHEEALSLLKMQLPKEIAESIERIHALARYGFDVEGGLSSKENKLGSGIPPR